ncbi:hypothetical protein [Escherichia coli]|uniref:hypothetical protein n=1 Tax=Escherichia coli TaxID=562 RepID=UPI001918E53F|nr:hypothetical protein [Escherichia coli]CAD6037140.1 Uncharacterised protein [Escherichia coli]CAD6099270.1 Uncharacterised protein [Escherichia coli]CAD6176183.1 Uncharacterised protein [Escherichia coli]
MNIRPTPDGFLRFVRGVMGVPDTAIADDSPTLECCYQTALELIPKNVGLEYLPIIYTNTVYSAGGSLLLRYAIDTPPSTYFADQRKKLNLNNPVYGLVNSAADQGTSGSMTISDALSNLSLADLMLMQDPWGRQVVAVLMEIGPLWGYTP